MVDACVPPKNAWACFLVLTPGSSFLPEWTPGGFSEDSGHQVSAIHKGSLDCVPSSLLQPGPTLVVVDIWGVDQKGA